MIISIYIHADIEPIQIPVLSLSELRCRNGNGRQFTFKLDDFSHLLVDIILNDAWNLVNTREVLLVPVEHKGCVKHDGHQTGQHRVILYRLVEILVPGAQGQSALVQLDHMATGVLVILSHGPNKEATNIIVVLKLLGDILEEIGWVI